MKRPPLLCALMAWSLAALAGAASPTTLPTTAPSGLDATVWDRMKAIDSKAATIDDLTADFEQKKFTPLLKRPMVSEGKVFAKGAEMLWDTRSPAPTLMRVDEKELQLYYVQQKTVEVYEIAGHLAELSSSPVPRLSTLLKHFNFAPAAASDFGETNITGKLALRMTPADVAIREHLESVTVLIDENAGIMLGFNLIDADGERTEMRFSNIRVNTKLDDARLRLVLPPDVKVVHPLEGAGAPPAVKPAPESK